MGTSLSAAAIQGINYCVQSGVPYFALTDGQHWELYETFQPVPLEEKVVVTLDLKSAVAETCLDAMALWRPSAAAASIRQAAKPLVGMSSAPLPTQTQSDTPAYGDASPIATDDGWLALSHFSPQVGAKPSTLRFPDGSNARTVNWGDFIVGIVGWLRSNGSLTEQQLPIRFGDQTNYIVSATPPDTPGFDGSGVYRQVGEWYVRTNYTGGQHARNAMRIIELAGLDPADFAVKLQ